MCSLDYVYNVNMVPRTYKQTMLSDEQPQWTGAMQKEFDTLVKTKTFILVDRPAHPESILTSRWVWSRKVDPDGNTIFKARLCARGFQQQWGLSYNDTYAPMSRLASIRILMFMCAQYGFVAHQIDVTAAYLNTDLDHVI